MNHQFHVIIVSQTSYSKDKGMPVQILLYMTRIISVVQLLLLLLLLLLATCATAVTRFLNNKLATC